MINILFTYTCDVEGCPSSAQTEETMGPGFAGLPNGWANLNWMIEAKPDDADPRRRYMSALKKNRERIPPELFELQKAGVELLLGERQPRVVRCKALICDKCLDKINLGNFDLNDGSGPLVSSL